MPSSLTAIPLVTDGSELTSGFFNSRFNGITDNFNTIQSGTVDSQSSNVTLGGFIHAPIGVGIGTYPPSSETQAGLHIGVNSNGSQYIYFTDSSGQRSSYALGSH